MRYAGTGHWLMSDETKGSIEREELLKTWERFNKAAQAEKRWMDQRLKWMFVPQSILIAAYGVIHGYPGKPIDGDLALILAPTISWIGLIMALLAVMGALAAGVMHWKWTTRLNELAVQIKCKSKVTDLEPKEMVPFGTKPYWPAGTSSIIPSLIASTFLFGWAILILHRTELVVCMVKYIDCVFFAITCLMVLVVIVFAIRRGANKPKDECGGSASSRASKSDPEGGM